VSSPTHEVAVVKLDLVLDDAALRKLLEQAPRRGEEAWRAVQFMRAQDLLDLAEPLTPRRRGRLWASRVATRTAPVVIAFTAPHAIPVHEMRARHPRGDWKYLERATNRLRSQGAARPAELFREAFKRGTRLADVRARHPERAGGAA
jgi:hypothetical protein